MEVAKAQNWAVEPQEKNVCVPACGYICVYAFITYHAKIYLQNCVRSLVIAISYKCTEFFTANTLLFFTVCENIDLTKVALS
jgi:hypothetical protein